jgi:hypothetical protein
MTIVDVDGQRNAPGQGHSQQNGFKLKSSLKKKGSASSPRTQNQSVRWAHEERNNAKESAEMPDVSSQEDGALMSLRVASAEACAVALGHAVQIVSSGNSEVENAGT